MAGRYPPPEHYGRSEYNRSGRYDRYDDRTERYDRSTRYDDTRSSGYSFRGVAETDSYRPRREEEIFSFRSLGPSFPNPERRPPQPQQQRPRRIETTERGQRQREPQGHVRGGRHTGGRYARGGGFRKPPPSERDILRHARRGSTPEQLSGMNTGQARFLSIEPSSDEDSDAGSEDGEVIDLTNDTDSESDSARRHKRVKTDAPPPAETAAPKWSNAEYLTALPPPENLSAPKKDIVQVIRKAKVESARKDDSANTLKDNADFISLTFDDDPENGNMSDSDSASDDMALRDAPSGPASMQPDGKKGLISRREQKKQVTNQFAALQSHKLPHSTKMNDDIGPPPRPPYGLILPTDEELVSQYSEGAKGKKRKHEKISRDRGDVLPEWQDNGSNPTPWCTVDHSRTVDTGLRLHKEIRDFYEFVQPYDYEESIRRDLISRVQQTIRTSSSKVTGATHIEVKSFGSFAAGLYLPTADMDLVAVSPGYMKSGQKSFCQSKTKLYQLSSQLEWRGIAAPGTIMTVANARVPIIKFTDDDTGIKVDISFENDSGLRANATFLEWKEQFPAMPIIVVLIKQMLAMRGLNEVFSGGLGGFSIICLVVSMMQMMPEIQSGNMDPHQHYGDLLLNFLHLYGNSFDVRSTGITMNPPGYFDKLRNPRAKQNANGLTIIDPNNRDNDISGGSREIDTVLDCFSHAHARIQQRLAHIRAGHDVEDSILGCVLGGNYTSFIHQRNKLSRLHSGREVSPQRVPIPQKKQTQAPGAPTRYRQRPQSVLVPGRPMSPEKHSGRTQQKIADMSHHPLPARPSGGTAANGPKRYVDHYVDPRAYLQKKHAYTHFRPAGGDSDEAVPETRFAAPKYGLPLRKHRLTTDYDNH